MLKLVHKIKKRTEMLALLDYKPCGASQITSALFLPLS